MFSSNRLYPCGQPHETQGWRQQLDHVYGAAQLDEELNWFELRVLKAQGAEESVNGSHLRSTQVRHGSTVSDLTAPQLQPRSAADVSTLITVVKL